MDASGGEDSDDALAQTAVTIEPPAAAQGLASPVVAVEKVRRKSRNSGNGNETTRARGLSVAGVSGSGQGSSRRPSVSPAASNNIRRPSFQQPNPTEGLRKEILELTAALSAEQEAHQVTRDELEQTKKDVENTLAHEKIAAAQLLEVTQSHEEQGNVQKALLRETLKKTMNDTLTTAQDEIYALQNEIHGKKWAQEKAEEENTRLLEQLEIWKTAFDQKREEVASLEDHTKELLAYKNEALTLRGDFEKERKILYSERAQQVRELRETLDAKLKYRKVIMYMTCANFIFIVHVKKALTSMLVYVNEMNLDLLEDEMRSKAASSQVNLKKVERQQKKELVEMGHMKKKGLTKMLASLDTGVADMKLAFTGTLQRLRDGRATNSQLFSRNVELGDLYATGEEKLKKQEHEVVHYKKQCELTTANYETLLSDHQSLLVQFTKEKAHFEREIKHMKKQLIATRLDENGVEDKGKSQIAAAGSQDGASSSSPPIGSLEPQEESLGNAAVAHSTGHQPTFTSLAMESETPSRTRKARVEFLRQKSEGRNIGRRPEVNEDDLRTWDSNFTSQGIKPYGANESKGVLNMYDDRVPERGPNRPRRIEKTDNSPSQRPFARDEMRMMRDEERMVMTSLEQRMLDMLPNVKPQSGAALGPIFRGPPQQKMSHSQSDGSLARPNRPRSMASPTPYHPLPLPSSVQSSV